MNIFVGNLSFDATQDELKKLFEGFGNVASAVIVMRKEKKAPKSRGFGFVQMPDEQQALAAIAALNGKEFMGRILNVDPARPKGQKAMVWPPIAKAKTETHHKHLALKDGQVRLSRQHLALKAPRPNGRAGTPPSAVDGRVRLSRQHLALNDGQVRLSRQPGTYKSGRRTHSYMKRRGLDGTQEEAKPRQKNQDNPMRWRKRKDQPRPWQKSPGEHRPWRKSEGGFKPGKKTEGESKPWKKAEGESKPWKKAEGESKPWKKPSGGAKPWSKSSARPQKSRFKGREKPGGRPSVGYTLP